MEESLVLTTKVLKKALGLGPGCSGSVSWSRGGEPFAWISYTTESAAGGPAVRLTYSAGSGEVKRSLDYAVRVVWSFPPFGGIRWFFLCPLVVSGRPCIHKAAKLYLPPGGVYFGCRRCYSLTYTSSLESRKYDSLFRELAAGMGQGWTPREVRAALSPRGKR